MATKTTNETLIECSADMKEDANTYEFQQQELPEVFFINLHLQIQLFKPMCQTSM